jgi:hypothetical protein
MLVEIILARSQSHGICMRGQLTQHLAYERTEGHMRALRGSEYGCSSVICVLKYIIFFLSEHIFSVGVR